MTAVFATEARAPAGIPATTAVSAALVVLLGQAAGFRWLGFGLDHANYLDFYARLPLFGDIGGDRFEAGFTAGAWAFKYILQLPYEFYAAFLATAALAIKFVLIHRHTRWPLLAVLAYCGLFYPLHEYTQLRAGVALAFGLLAIDRYLARRYVQAALLLFLGTTFHSSVAVLGAVMLLFPLTQSRSGLALLGLVAALALAGRVPGIDLFSLALRFPEFVERYTNEFVDSASTFKPANLLLMLALVWLALTGDLATRSQRLHALCCLASLIAYYLLIELAAVAYRLQEMLSLPVVLLAFRFAPWSPGAIAALIILVSAAYQLYIAFTVGIFG